MRKVRVKTKFKTANKTRIKAKTRPGQLATAGEPELRVQLNVVAPADNARLANANGGAPALPVPAPMPAPAPSGFAPALLSPLEIYGAVCARVNHDLSSMISGIMGNAEYVSKAITDPVLLKAVDGITTSSNMIAKVLGQCLPYQQSISAQAVPCDVGEVVTWISEGAFLAPGWRVMPLAAPLTGEVKVQPRWLVSVIWQIARETQTMHGEVEFASGPAVFPVLWRGQCPGHLFQITLSYRGDEPLALDSTLVTPERPALLAAFELIRRFKGQVQFHPNTPGRQQIFILLPLA